MLYFKIQSLMIYIQFFIYVHSLEDMNGVYDNLTDEERNSRCCAKHMNCCKQKEEPTNFEVRALLVKCAKLNKCPGNGKSSPCVQNKQTPYYKIPGEKCDKKPKQEEVLNCEKKLKLTIKIKNSGTTNCKSQYIIIDHVFDSLTEKKQKILNPYVLKLSQRPVMQAYGLVCENEVNSQASEKVLNKKDEGYTGCSTDPSQSPTCGSVKYKNEVIPYSTGFCCSCNKDDSGKNVDDMNFTNSLNIPSVINGVESSKKTRNSYNIPGINKNNNYEFSGKDGKAKEETLVINIPNVMPDNGDYSGSLKNVDDDRLIPITGTVTPLFLQKRGGQDCNDKYTPPDADPDSYHDSSHCLEFSDIWYSVYRLDEPKFKHSLHIQIYEKFQDRDGNFKWRDVTKCGPIIIGTDNPHYTNDENTLTANYKSKIKTPNSKESPCCLNYKIHKLLIPDITNIDVSSYPELQGGPAEYLVVNDNEVQPDGKTCNVAGVGYEGFVKQPERCSVPKNSCLENQPKQLWEKDHQAEASGGKGSHFLKYFGVLPENPIITDENTQNKTLTLYYAGPYTGVLDIEIKADRNVILRPNSAAIITEVYIDSSNQKKTSIIVKVFNSGLVSSILLVSLTDCPLYMPASFNNIVSKQVLIAPQRQHIFHLQVECPLPKKKLFCTVQVQNARGEIIAVRNIRLRKLDRCICIWHCLCACLLADGALKCKPMSLEHYHAAGFQGSLPVALHVVQYTFLDDMISLMLYILLFLSLTLFVMGLIKALVGCCMVPVGLWGLDLILDLPKKMNSYYESNIRHRKVIYDENGWPIHPDTHERVRNIALPAEFCINVVFFFIYPFAVLWVIIKKLCFSSYSEPKDYSDLDICKCKTISPQKSSHTSSLLRKEAPSKADNKSPSKKSLTPKGSKGSKVENKSSSSLKRSVTPKGSRPENKSSSSMKRSVTPKGSKPENKSASNHNTGSTRKLTPKGSKRL